MATSVLLEFSEDPLSDVTPTWVDVTAYLMDARWWDDQQEGDEPNPGGAAFVMLNDNRDWEPDFAGGRFYPNVTTQRRFRLTVNGTVEGVFYASAFEVDYPGKTTFSTVTVTCGDGSEVVALDDLPQLDPPDASSYPDVVGFDDAWGYWRLGEAGGTKARAIVTRHSRTVRRHGEKVRRKWRTRHGTRWSTAAEVGAVAGPAGVYGGLPKLGQPGLILGDADTAVEFGPNQAVTVEADDDSFKAGNAVSCEAWVKPTALPSVGTCYLILGPEFGGSGDVLFGLSLERGPSSNSFRMHVEGASTSVDVSGTTNPTAGNTYHVVGTFDGDTTSLYVNGVLEATGAGLQMATPNANPVLLIASMGGAGNAVVVDEPAVYEHALTAGRVLAHYQAGAERGYGQQTAGARIADLAAHALWSETNIQTSGRDVQPSMKTGQPRLGEIAELAHAEGPRTMFFFNGAGDPVYLGHEWQASSASYNTVQATFGDTGAEVRYEDVALVYDNETFNAVTVSHEAGDLVEVEDAAAIADKGRRANTEWTDVLLVDHNHVESLAYAVLAYYKEPSLRPDTLTITSNTAAGLAQITARQIGHLVRFRLRGEGGVAIDRVCTITGRRLHVDPDRIVTCIYRLSRGFNAAVSPAVWRAGIVGFSEAGSTTVAA